MFVCYFVCYFKGASLMTVGSAVCAEGLLCVLCVRAQFAARFCEMRRL